MQKGNRTEKVAVYVRGNNWKKSNLEVSNFTIQTFNLEFDVLLESTGTFLLTV